MSTPWRFSRLNEYKPPKYFYIPKKLWLYVEILGWLVLDPAVCEQAGDSPQEVVVKNAG